MCKVYIDPRTTITYATYYIQGLYNVLGKKNVRFSSGFFSDWPNHRNTNEGRYHYILACNQNPDINFEDGFFINKKEWRNTPIPDNIPRKLFYYKFISNKTYLKNMQKSLFAFNTPAVHNCHGWKLGKFLCMGKVITSTPLVNDLPVSLEHGKHIYFVNSEQDIENTVQFLLKDSHFRQHLEQKANVL
jgi:hypothetical protein